jgi:hypothetical protein
MGNISPNYARFFRIARRSHAIVLLLSIGATAAIAQNHFRYDGKATSLTVLQYEKLVTDGTLLSPEGWKRAAKLFEVSIPYPEAGVIDLTSTGGFVGETSRQNDLAEVWTKWTDNLGSIDSALRYRSPDQNVVGTIYVFHLVFIGRKWKIAGLSRNRTATVDRALRYVTEMRNRSADPVIRENANKTIAVLKRLNSRCGHSSAC